MCVVIFLFILLIQWIGGAHAAESDRTKELREGYERGIPYDFTYYPNLEIEVEVSPGKRLRCNACVLEEYYSTTPEQRLDELRIIWERYNQMNKESQ